MPSVLTLLGLLLVSCGDASPDPEEATALPAAEGGEAVEPLPVPPPDLVSLVPADANVAVLVRFDLVRSSPLAALAAALVQEEGELRALAEIGVDPLRDIDRVVAAGGEPGSDLRVLAVEHRWSEPQLLDVYARLSDSPGVTPTIVPQGPYRVASFPGRPTSLVLFTPTVAAVVSSTLLPDFLARAGTPGTDAGPVGQRLRQLESRAPDLAPAAAVRFSAVPARGDDWSRETGRFGLQAPGWFAATLALQDGAAGFGHAGYASPEAAQTAAQSLRSMTTQALHPAALMVRMMGLGRALESTEVAAEGTEVSFRVRLQPQELDLLTQRLRDGVP